MCELEDSGTWILIYNDETTPGSITSEEDLAAAIEKARLNVLPDFWVDPTALTIKFPPYKTTDRINTAICKRYKPTSDWSEYPILKARIEAPKSTYKEALEWMKICQEESSGAEDAFNALGDKSKRKDRAKGSKYENGDYVDPTKSKLHLTKTEPENSKTESVMEVFNKLPDAPPQVLLSTGKYGVTEPTDTVKITDSSDQDVSESFQKSDCFDAEHEDEPEIQNDNAVSKEFMKSKPIIKTKEDIGQRYKLTNKYISIKQGNNQKLPTEKQNPKTGKSNNKKNDDTVIPCTSTSTQSNVGQYSPVNNVGDIPDISSLLTDLQHSIYVNSLPATEAPSDMSKFCEIMQAIGVKLDTIMKLMNQMIVNQCKANVVGQPAPAQTEENWLETRTLLKRFFAEMDTVYLFKDFDQRLKESRKFRAKVAKYLMEKISQGDWKQTARDVLNAIMHLNVQKLYSGIGQPWRGKSNHSLVKTSVYSTLEAMVKISIKKDEVVSAREIQSYFGKYIRTAKTRAGEYPCCKKRKKKSGTEGLIRDLLYGPTDAQPASPSDREDDSDNEEEPSGSKRKKRRLNTGDKGLPGSDNEIAEREEPESCEEQEEQVQKLTESQKLENAKKERAQNSMLDEILNVSPDEEDENTVDLPIGEGEEST